MACAVAAVPASKQLDTVYRLLAAADRASWLLIIARLVDEVEGAIARIRLALRGGMVRVAAGWGENRGSHWTAYQTVGSLDEGASKVGVARHLTCCVCAVDQ